MISNWKNEHFEGLSFKLNSQNLSNTALQVLLLHVTKDDNIIQVDHAVCEIQLTQGILHEMLKSHGGITQPKRHAGELIEPEVAHCEGCVLLQLRHHLDLLEA